MVYGHRDVNQLHEVPQETHNGEPYSYCSADLEVFWLERREGEKGQQGREEGESELVGDERMGRSAKRAKEVSKEYNGV